MVNSWELGKQDITGEYFKKYGANDALNETGDDALCEESEISDHMSTIISTKEAMHFVVPR
jgi:hypothetical protein